MSKELTPRQKTIQVQRAIKSFLKNELEPIMLDYVANDLSGKKASDVCLESSSSKVYNTVVRKFTKNV